MHCLSFWQACFVKLLRLPKNLLSPMPLFCGAFKSHTSSMLHDELLYYSAGF